MGDCLGGKGTKDSWLIFRDDLVRAQERSIAMYRKSNKRSRSPAWMNMELLPELKHRKEVHRRWKQEQGPWEHMEQQSSAVQNSAGVETGKEGEGQQERFL